MAIRIIFILASLLSVSASYGQHVETDSVAENKISELEFIVGQWSGKGWTFGPDRNRHYFEQTENIVFKLDSTAILIEGRGPLKEGSSMMHWLS